MNNTMKLTLITLLAMPLSACDGDGAGALILLILFFGLTNR